jgi:AraC-like DNA-binding protein
MEKLDISKEKIYLKNLSNVIKSGIYNNPKIENEGRHSDAFVYILSGNCRYNIDDEYSFVVGAGDILYLANKENYKMDVLTSEYEFIYCDFEFDSEVKRKSTFYTMKNKDEVENLFRKLLNSYRKSSAKSFYDAMSMLYLIYGEILESSENTYLIKDTKNKILKQKEYIDANFSDLNLSVSFLAEKAGMSEVYFRRLFKTVYGISPIDYITMKRIENAKKLMRYPFLNLGACAKNSGFSSLEYFCRVFKKKTGISPAKYRKDI